MLKISVFEVKDFNNFKINKNSSYAALCLNTNVEIQCILRRIQIAAHFVDFFNEVSFSVDS